MGLSVFASQRRYAPQAAYSIKAFVGQAFMPDKYYLSLNTPEI